MEILALIPARGGSKRIPRKNIKPFAGKPLLVWTIEEAKKSKYISRVIVSTDDIEIADCATKYGAEVPFIRPGNIAQDLTPDLPVFQHVLSFLAQKEGKTPEIIAHLRANVPFRTADDMDIGIEMLVKNHDYDSVRAVINAPLHPLKTYRLEGRQLLPYISENVSGIKEAFNQPVQGLPKAYAACGYFSAMRSDTITKGNSMTGDKILGYIVDSFKCIDIDTSEEFEFAELRMQKLLQIR